MVTLSSSIGISRIGRVYRISRPFPLVGHIAFGIIDRGYNNLQVRVTSLCPLSCIFCSVAAGPHSKRKSDFILSDPQWLAEWVEYAVGFKGEVHVLFDGIGDPITNIDLPKFVAAVRRVRGVKSIAVETRLFPASEKLIDQLREAGVERLNVSIDTTNEEKGKILAGNSAYSVRRVIDLISYAWKEKGMDVHIAPVWLPGVNDEDIEDIIELVIKMGLGGKIPPLGIQKFVAHKYGRKPEGVREVSWSEFRSFLERLEEKYGIKLILSPEDYGLERAPRIPIPYKKHEVLKLTVVGEGLLRNEYLALSKKKDRVFTLVSRKMDFEAGDVVVSEVIQNRDGILMAVPA